MTRVARLFRSRYVRNVTMLASGTGFAQVLVVAATPLLTRLFTPDEFGVYSNYVAVFSVLVVVANLRYELAVSLPTSDDEGADLVALCLVAVACLTCLVAAITLAAGGTVAAVIGIPEIAPYLWLLGPGTLAAGTYASLDGWAVRVREFRTLARTQVQQGSGMVATHLIAGAAGAGAGGLILGGIVGRSAGVVALARSSRRTGLSLAGLRSASRLRAVLVRYRRFPLLSGSAALLQTAARGLPVILVTRYFGPTAAGHLGLALYVLALPATFLGQAVAGVFFGEASALQREGDAGGVRRLLLRTVGAQAAIGVVVVGAAAAVAPFVVPLVFGREWTEVATYIQLLAVMILVQFVASPLTAMFDLAERQGVELLTEVVKVVSLVVPIVVIAEAGGSARLAIGGAAVGGALAYVVVLLAVVRVSHVDRTTTMST
ncbi:MAG: lipopolysaccharide biosynthesis protein [Acidimicrobiales bacterium]